MQIESVGHYLDAHSKILAALSGVASPPRNTALTRATKGPVLAGFRGSPRSISDWRKFYAGREGDDYRKYHARQYAPFIDAVVQEMGPGDTLLEAGCGLGHVTKRLWDLTPSIEGLQFIAMDNDQPMVRDAKWLLRDTATVVRGDIRYDTFIHCDVIHGHGVLEHMSNKDIMFTLSAHRMSGARVAIHYVPGDGGGTPSFGDERLESLKWWESNWAPTSAFAFNGGKDYVLTWRF